MRLGRIRGVSAMAITTGIACSPAATTFGSGGEDVTSTGTVQETSGELTGEELTGGELTGGELTGTDSSGGAVECPNLEATATPLWSHTVDPDHIRFLDGGLAVLGSGGVAIAGYGLVLVLDDTGTPSALHHFSGSVGAIAPTGFDSGVLAVAAAYGDDVVVVHYGDGEQELRRSSRTMTNGAWVIAGSLAARAGELSLLVADDLDGYPATVHRLDGELDTSFERSVDVSSRSYGAQGPDGTTYFGWRTGSGPFVVEALKPDGTVIWTTGDDIESAYSLALPLMIAAGDAVYTLLNPDLSESPLYGFSPVTGQPRFARMVDATAIAPSPCGGVFAVGADAGSDANTLTLRGFDARGQELSVVSLEGIVPPDGYQIERADQIDVGQTGVVAVAVTLGRVGTDGPPLIAVGAY